MWKENKTSVLTPMYSFFSFQVQHMKFKILKRKISQLTIKIFHDISDISASLFFGFFLFVNLIFFPYKMSYFLKLINENLVIKILSLNKHLWEDNIVEILVRKITSLDMVLFIYLLFVSIFDYASCQTNNVEREK